MDLPAAGRAWDEDGFVVLPAYLPAAQLAPGVAELPLLFPTAAAFHDGPDAAQPPRFADEFGGIDRFPFASTELNLLAVHPDLVVLAAALLGTDRLRVISIEAWAKYTGAAEYEQQHHRDFLSHTLVVPSRDRRYRVVEMFVYLADVPATLGPPCFVPRSVTAPLPALPNWLSPDDGARPEPGHPGWSSPRGHPELYAAEVRAEGPAGTVVAYDSNTFHRGTALTAPRGARFTLHVTLRPEGADWLARHSWVEQSNHDRWHAFVARASPEQLALFGFPPPGHPYWTDATLEGTATRYPGLDVTRWRRSR